MSTNELNNFLQTFQKPAILPDERWQQNLQQSRRIWHHYLEGEEWSQPVEIDCRESLMMLVDRDGKLIVRNESLLQFVQNRCVQDWRASLEERAFEAASEGRYHQSEHFFCRAIQLDEANAINHYRRALVRMKLRQFSAAAADLNTAISIQPDADKFYVCRAEVYRLMDIDHRALADMNKAIRLNPENDEAIEMRGKLRVSLGDKVGGRTDLNRAAEVRSLRTSRSLAA